MVFIPRIDIFKSDVYAGKHQIQRSCLIDYGISCVNIYPFDYMHLALLGAVKGLILFLKEGPQGQHRLSAAQSPQKLFQKIFR